MSDMSTESFYSGFKKPITKPEKQNEGSPEPENESVTSDSATGGENHPRAEETAAPEEQPQSFRQWMAYNNRRCLNKIRGRGPPRGMFNRNYPREQQTRGNETYIIPQRRGPNFRGAQKCQVKKQEKSSN